MSACFGIQRVMPDTMPPDPAKHVNYVRGMVLEVDEFKQEFAYHAGRDRSLAREAIGYGTLRGLALSWLKDSSDKLLPSVLVKAGIALTPCGQLICVGSDQCADINLWLAGRTDEISAQFAANATTGEMSLHVTLAYSDCPTDDAPVPGEPCRSEQDLMQPSRITDSFQLELSYEAPLQAEEDALRGFYIWLRKLNIVQDASVATSVAMDVFMAAVRAWDSSATDPASLTIRTSDVPIYSTVAMRLWVTELRAQVERSGAWQRFKLWVESVPHTSSGTATEQEFLAEVRRWSPRTYTWPIAIVVNDSTLNAFVDKGKSLWDSEISLKWYAEPCGCRAPNNPEYCDDRLLLGTLRFSVIKTSGNVWMVDMPATSTTTPPPVSPSVDESNRPILAQLRALEAQLIPAPELVAEGMAPVAKISALIASQVTTYRHVAMGRLIPGAPQTTPVLGNLKASATAVGEVSFTFDGYVLPDSGHDYVVQTIASFHVSATSNKSQPAVRFAGFNTKGFVYKVTRSNTSLTTVELGTMEFQVNVSIIEMH
jgi:hypothetical protein